jgi:tRNA pseudouridine38-40 synthase
VVSKRRIRLLLEYDGTDFSGFQLQGQGERTVQGVLESAILRVSGTQSTVYGAGRTDTGVHARGQVVHFDSEWQIPVNKIATVLNGSLPLDLAVRGASDESEDFHARFSAKQRTYIYLLWTAKHRSALWGRYTVHEPRELDMTLMTEAAIMLSGKQEYAAFANRSSVTPPSTVRDVKKFEVRSTSNGKMIVFKLSADGFLRSMVRNLVGGLMSVGLGQTSLNRLMEIAEVADRSKNPCPTAPPQGLCLWRVDY